MRTALFLSLAIGCGHSGDADGSSSPTGSAGSSGDGSGTTPGSSEASGASDGSGSVDTTGGDNGLSHGFVRLQLVRGASETGDPFAGTARVIAVLQYADCLVAFYGSHPELAQTGADGMAIFGGNELGGEGWLDRLCTPTVAGQIDCTVEAIVQDVATVQTLTIVYNVSGAIEDGLLLFGPLPTATTADCSAGLEPSVRVGPTNAVSGNADNGTQLWGTEAFAPPEATTNQAAPIQIQAAAIGG